jgi:lipopolysaccharide transport system permease protein
MQIKRSKVENPISWHPASNRAERMILRSLIYKRDLLLNLVQRDIKLHYRRSILGILWAQINPLLSLLIFSFVFQTIVPLNIPHYTAYVFTGLLAWNWFSASLNGANYSLVNSRDLVRKPQFQTEMIVAASVATNLVNYLLALPVLLGLLLLNGLVPNWTIIFLPVLIAIQYGFTMGLALLISATNIFFRDILHIIAVLTSVWFYLTPVFYSIASRSEYAWIINLNPMYHFLVAYRQIFIDGQTPDLVYILLLGVLAIAVYGLGYTVFQRLKYSFVDEL